MEFFTDAENATRVFGKCEYEGMSTLWHEDCTYELPSVTVSES